MVKEELKSKCNAHIYMHLPHNIFMKRVHLFILEVEIKRVLQRRMRLNLNYWGWGSAHRAHSPWLPQMKINLPRHDLLGEERWPISQRRRTKSLFLDGLLLGPVCTGIQVKLINHCQAVRV